MPLGVKSPGPQALWRIGRVSLCPLERRSPYVGRPRHLLTSQQTPPQQRLEAVSWSQNRFQSTTFYPGESIDWKQSLPDPPPPPSKYRFLRTIFAAAIFTLFGVAVGSSAALFYFRIGLPTDEETLTMFEPAPNSFAAEVEAYMQSHPLTKSLLADPELQPSRPQLKIPEKMLKDNFTAGALLGERKIETPPLAFSTQDGSRFVSIQFLGPALCGHQDVVHGGLLATLLDEGMARCCFPTLPKKVGVTANLKLNYVAPCMASQFVVLRAETTKVQGRKAWVKGWIETLPAPEEWEAGSLNGGAAGVKPVRLVEAEAMFVQPPFSLV